MSGEPSNGKIEVVKPPLTPSEDEQIIVLFSGATIFMGIVKKNAHVGEKGFMLREAYGITISTTVLPSQFQGGQPKLATNIAITAPPAAGLDPKVKTAKLWVGQMDWAYTPTPEAVEAVRKALENQANLA